jgi:putative DNA primase/helicase
MMTASGLYWQDPGDQDRPPLLLAGCFDVVAETRDAGGDSWGILVRWLDHDGREHRVPLARAMFAGDGVDARRVLMDGGLFISPGRKARELLTAFLIAARSSARVTATSRIGWHGSAFVLPTTSFGCAAGQTIMLQGTTAPEHAFRERGTLDEWKNNVARLAVGNSRLVLAISAAFAAPLIEPCQAESGGIHFRGASSTGKSTALIVAGSAWGGGEPGGYIRPWRATANGLEGVALGHCDSLLCLDELSQIASRDAGEAAYMLANGSGKSRSRRDGTARAPSRWRVLFLSSGEIGLADKINEDGRGRKPAAGQQVRIVDIPADAGTGYGLFENIHGYPSAEAFARDLRAAAGRHYGTAAQAFLVALVNDLAGLPTAVATYVNAFIAEHVPGDADGQVQRVAHRFALIAAGGELAVETGVLPWPRGEATNAAARCFQDWLISRGGTEPAEIRDGIAQVRSFLMAHGMARLLPAWEAEERGPVPPRDIAGFRKRSDDGWDYFITASAWREEVCRGFDPTSIAKAMAARGLLKPGDGRHLAKSVQVPGIGKVRLYHVLWTVLEGGHDE